MELAASGSSFGGVLYPIIFVRLEPKIDFGWATRVVAFIVLATMTVSIAVMRTRILSASRRAIFQADAFTEPPFTFFTLGLFFGFMGMYIPFYYVSTYAVKRADLNPSLAFYFLPIINAGSVPGRILPNFVADKIGPYNVLIPFAMCSAVLALAWMSINNMPGIIVFVVLYGFFSGAFVSLPGPAVASITKDMSKLGSRMGTSFLFSGLGILIGNPVAGALIDLEKASFWKAQTWCEVLVFVAMFSMLGSRIAQTGFRLWAKS